MKKLLLIIGLFIFISSLTIKTHAYNYDFINDNTSIKSDFEVLGLNYDDYHKNDNYNDYNNFYVVAMSEVYLKDSDKIQTYFYLYNPLEITYFTMLSMTYTLNDVEHEFNFKRLRLDSTANGLYKIKGFTYDFIENSKIEIKGINYLAGLWPTYSSSTFSSSNEHNITNTFNCELSFNSLLIISEYNVVELEVVDEDNLFQNWKDWDFADYSVLVYFYNFNFPDHIEYDTVEYAKFKYNYNTYEETFLLFWDNKKLLSSETAINEYKQGESDVRVGSEILISSLPTFYLGNRYENGQFEDSNNKITAGDFSYFNVDCSILLDSTICKETVNPYTSVKTREYTSLDDVEIIELHYQNDGVLYKSQVVSKPVDEEDFGHITIVDEDESFLDKLLAWLEDVFDWFLKNSDMLIWIIILVFAIILFGPILIPFIFSIIKSIFSTLINLVKSLFKRKR